MPARTEAVLQEQQAIVAMFMKTAREWRAKARMYAAKDAGYAYGIAASCIEHAKGYEAAAEMVVMRTGLSPCSKCHEHLCSCRPKRTKRS